MRWVGLDLHQRSITASALDDDGHVVAEHRRLPADVVSPSIDTRAFRGAVGR
ncbi:MAG TPA: hypothetical protein VNL18_11175 [Gemmatimonadales bacterium]|nr:hypothetical protein [Gemmatimonadales bacterium]